MSTEFSQSMSIDAAQRMLADIAGYRTASGGYKDPDQNYSEKIEALSRVHARLSVYAAQDLDKLTERDYNRLSGYLPKYKEHGIVSVVESTVQVRCFDGNFSNKANILEIGPEGLRVEISKAGYLLRRYPTILTAIPPDQASKIDSTEKPEKKKG